MKTLRQAAEEIGITYGTARTIAAKHNIGTLLTPRQRVLSAADVRELARIAKARKPGNPGDRDKHGRFK